MESIEASYPLTSVQHGMLFHRQRGGAHTGVDIEQMIAALHEELDGDALHRAWTRVVERHPILRTALFWEGMPEPVQAVRATVSLRLERLDWTGLPEHAQAACLAERSGVKLSPFGMRRS